MNPYPVLLGLVLLVALAAVIWAVRTRPRGPKAPPKLDLSDTAYSKALRQWQHDYIKGTDTRPDFPSPSAWKAEQTFEYYQRHGVWPGEEIPHE